jgi:peptidyl-prolyl cis-trans isomerase B (cyclophilin B)
MRLSSTPFALILFLAAASLAAQDAVPSKLWFEVDQYLPRRGQMGTVNSPSAAIDWAEQVNKAEQVMVRAGQTPVEPYAMFYLGNFYFEAGRLDEALAMFETIRSSAPDHPLVKLSLSKDQKPVVLQAIEDCAAEIAWRNRHPRPPLPVPALDPKVTATIHLSTGDVKVRFYRNVAPKHVENFLKHAAAGDYDGTKVTQVVPESVVNLGDPTSKGTPPGGAAPAPNQAAPSQPHEFANLSHVRGMVAMTRHMLGMESSTMPFQIMLKDQPYFDFTQTIFGRVVEGVEVIDAISRLPKNQYQVPATDVLIKSITIKEE